MSDGGGGAVVHDMPVTFIYRAACFYSRSIGDTVHIDTLAVHAVITGHIRLSSIWVPKVSSLDSCIVDAPHKTRYIVESLKLLSDWGRRAPLYQIGVRLSAFADVLRNR